MTNRIVIIATAVLSLLVALAPVVGDLDWQSTAGLIAGLGTVAAVVLKWLDGWQQYEKASMQRQLIHEDAAAAANLQAAAAEQAKAVGSRQAASKLGLPR